MGIVIDMASRPASDSADLADLAPESDSLGGAGGALGSNLVHFARVLRAAGLPIGPAAVLDALGALSLLDLGCREDVRACLRAIFVHRREDLELFEQAFRLFFRPHQELHSALSLLLPQSRLGEENVPANISRRVAEALPPPPARLQPRRRPEPEADLEVDASLTASDIDVLRQRDFAAMSAEELAQARRLLLRLRFAVQAQPTRRMQPARIRDAASKLDLRRVLRASLRTGGVDLPLCYRHPRRRIPPLVVLCDISGSMARYTEMLMRFAHTLMTARERVEIFLLGTRLTVVTRWLRGRDIDLSLQRCGKQVVDWGGGTRLGPCLREFNHRWSRRVLGQRAIVLLITDGLERESESEPSTDLAAEAARLRRSCQRLVWLNPLLSYAGFTPRARGIRALLPHVDEFRPVHNLESLEQLTASLAQPPTLTRTRR